MVPGHTYLPGSPVASPTLQVHGDTRQMKQGFGNSSGPLRGANNARHLPKLAPHAHGPRKLRHYTDKADKNKPGRRQAGKQAGRQAGRQESGKKAKAGRRKQRNQQRQAEREGRKTIKPDIKRLHKLKPP